VPAFGHTEFTGATSIGLQIEPEAIKRALWPRDLTDVAWAKTNVSAAKNAVGLDGVTNSASTLTATAGNGTCLQTVTIANAARTYTVYIKRVTGAGDIDITDNNGANWTTLTGLSSSAWTKHTLKRTQANPVFGIRIVTDTDAVEVDFSDIEDGPASTSPMIHTSAIITREAVIATMLISSFDFNQNKGRVVVEGTTGEETTANSMVIQIDNGGGDDRFIMNWRNDAGKIHCQTFNSGGNDGNASIEVGIPANTAFKGGYSYAQDNYVSAQDGVLSNIDTSADFPLSADVTIIRFGHNHVPADFVNSHIGRVRIWNDESHTELEKDTT
jgi:hypothetical protein